MPYELVEESASERRYIDPDTGAGKLVLAGRKWGRTDGELLGDRFVIHNPRGDLELDTSQAFDLKLEHGRAAYRVQRWKAGAWEDLPQGLVQVSAVARSIKAFGATLSIDDRGKWSFAITADQKGRYRLVWEVTLSSAQDYVLLTRKPGLGGGQHAALFETCIVRWVDMIDDVDLVDVTRDGVVLFSKPFDLARGETKVLDPDTGALGAYYSTDIGNASGSYTRYYHDGSDWVGEFGGELIRTVNRWDITSLSASDTVTQVDTRFYVESVSGSPGNCYVGPYNGDGQANPATDSDSTAWARCDTSSDYYVNSSAYTSTGWKSHTDMGATAEADVEAARDAGTIFSIAHRDVNEDTDYFAMAEDNEANDAELTIHYTTGGGIDETDLDRNYRRGQERGVRRGVA